MNLFFYLSIHFTVASLLYYKNLTTYNILLLFMIQSKKSEF